MTTKTTPTTNGDAEQAMEMGQQSLLAMTQMHSRMMRGALEVNAALVDFARKRIDEDIRTNDELSRCGSMDEAVKVMSGFYQNAFKAYADEANHLMKIGAEAMNRSVEEQRAG